jgi:UDP-3-O-[3-hydroxymyristoyl] glucosamine N-acyltransferase
MQQSVEQLAALVSGRVHGEPRRPIRRARPVSEAAPGDVTFVENERYARYLSACQASAVVVPAALAAQLPDLLADLPPHLSVIVVADALSAFIQIAQHLRGVADSVATGIDPRAAIHPSASVGLDPSIHPFVVVGEGAVIGARCRLHPGVVIGRNCRLGDDVTLYPHVVLYDDVVVGNRVTLHAHVVLGADGFGYRLQDGRHVKVPQLGRVEIGDDVEIGACSTIDRATFQATRVGEGTKIDNLVMIGHNCQIGAHNLLVAQVGIAGSCKTGDYVVLAGQAGIADHVVIGDRVVVGAQAGVHRDVAPGDRVFGSPARLEGDAKRIVLCLDQLPEIRRDMRALKQHLGLDRPERAAG